MKLRRSLLFFLVAAVLVYGVFFLGAPIGQAQMADRRYRDIFLIAAGLSGLIGGVVWKRTPARFPEERILIWSAIALPCWALIQFIPLPVGLVGLMSPARAEMLRGLEPLFGPRTFASLSVAPGPTMTHFLLFAAYAVLLLAAREFATALVDDGRRRIWMAAAPVVLAAIVEAVAGLAQLFGGEDMPEARGTYPVRNHLAGLLELAMPFALMYGVAGVRAARTRKASAREAWLRAAAGFMAAALLLAGVLSTLSRGGFAALVGSGLVMTALAIGRDMPPGKRILAASIACVVVVLAAFYLTPMALLARISERSSAGRLLVWGEALNVIRTYPLAGCGLGGFESAFLKFKAGLGTFTVDYAHNDYLQLLAELGVVGFAVGAMLIGSAVVRSVRAAATESSELRWVGLACLGSLVAILVHSMVDFNLYVAANASVVAWICGMAAGLGASRGRERTIEIGRVRRESVLQG